MHTTMLFFLLGLVCSDPSNPTPASCEQVISVPQESLEFCRMNLQIVGNKMEEEDDPSSLPFNAVVCSGVPEESYDI